MGDSSKQERLCFFSRRRASIRYILSSTGDCAFILSFTDFDIYSPCNWKFRPLRRPEKLCRPSQRPSSGSRTEHAILLIRRGILPSPPRSASACFLSITCAAQGVFLTLILLPSLRLSFGRSHVAICVSPPIWIAQLRASFIGGVPSMVGRPNLGDARYHIDGCLENFGYT